MPVMGRSNIRAILLTSFFDAHWLHLSLAFFGKLVATIV